MLKIQYRKAGPKGSYPVSLRASIKVFAFASAASPKVLLLLLRVKRALMRSEA